MNIYKLERDFNYAIVDVDGLRASVSPLDIDSNSTKFLDNFKFQWEFDDNEPIPDMSIIMYQVLCCRKEVRDSLLLEFPSLQSYAIKIDSNEYYSLPDVLTLENALNLQSSKITYFSTGDINEISECVFNQMDYPILFKIPEIVNTIFCSDLFRTLICKNEFTGLKFIKCKVKSKTWFRK